MERDLWGFKDVRELEKSTKDMPDMILRTDCTFRKKDKFYDLRKTCLYPSKITIN